MCEKMGTKQEDDGNSWLDHEIYMIHGFKLYDSYLYIHNNVYIYIDIILHEMACSVEKTMMNQWTERATVCTANFQTTPNGYWSQEEIGRWPILRLPPTKMQDLRGFLILVYFRQIMLAIHLKRFKLSL